MEKLNFNSKEFEIFIIQKINKLAQQYGKMQYLTLKEAANILKVSQRTMTHLVQDSYVDCYRIPSKTGEKRNYRFKLTDLENFMQSNKVVCVDSVVKNAFKSKNIEKEKIKTIIKSISE